MTGMNCADDGIDCIERRRLEADNERLRSDRRAAAEAHDKLEADNARLRALVKGLADDLSSELDGRYKDSAGTIHPALQRRYERDMANVYEARRAVEHKP